MTTSGDVPEVLSAFLDNEPFDPSHLLAALDDPANRVVLVDLIALRHLARHDADAAAIAPRQVKSSAAGWRLMAAAILLPLSLAAGYGAGWLAASSSSPGSSATSESAPAPTRIVPLIWQESTGGN